MAKIIGVLIFTLFCVAFALIPEACMMFAWGLIHPESELAKVLILGIFWFGGAGLCFLFGVLGFGLWAIGIEVVAGPGSMYTSRSRRRF